MDDLLLAPIKRARGYYLYTYNGRRYCDLFLNHATALSGHNPQAYTNAIKNVSEQGLYSPLPSLWQQRLHNALQKKFNSSVHFAYQIPTLSPNSDEPVCRVGIAHTSIKDNTILLLPEPLQLYTIILNSKTNVSAIIPPFLCRASLRALSYWDKIGPNNDLVQIFSQFPHLFTLQGFYFTSPLQGELYNGLFNTMLSIGFLLPTRPYYWGALVATPSKGELQKLSEVLLNYQI
jgi:hypothetical protein